MTEYRYLKIACSTSSNSGRGYIKFYLDDYVSFSNAGEKYIKCVDRYPFNRNSSDDGSILEIDNDKTRYYSSEHIFDETCVKFVKRELRDLRSKIESLERRVSSSESNSSTQLVLRRNVETDLSVIRGERDNLRGRIYSLESSSQSLETRNYDLQRERDNYQQRVYGLESTNFSLQNQLTRKDGDIE